MSQSTDKNKLIIDTLLNAYSVDAIISSFYSIDERIIALIKFSSEDFIHFNTIFRKVHEEINLLSANSRRLYACFNEEMNRQYAAAIHHSVTVLFENLHRFENLIEFNRKVHEQLLQKLEQIYIPVNNFYQDLNALQLLSANLKLDPVLHGQHGERINSNIEDIFHTYPNFLEGLKKLKKFVSNSCTAIGSLKKNYLDSAYHILSFCQRITDTILKKEQQAKEFKPILEKILDQTTEISSVIITHLQCQDIVQQKIEHVKGIHNEIINKLLVLVNQTGQADYELTRAKLFFQVKEIAHLQSAQMVHANREYQKAVEVVNTEYFHLSDCIREMDILYKTFTTLDKAIDGNGFDADLNIRKEVNLYNEIDAIHNIFRLQTEAITQRIINLTNSFALILKTCSDFQHIINAIRQQLHTPIGDENATIILQMSEVVGDLLKTVNGVKTILDKNADAASLLQYKYNEEYLGNHYEAIQKQEVKTLSNAFRELNYLNREVLQVLNAKWNSFQVQSKFKESIESVRYYDHFENEITHIIHCLDEISDRMNAGDAVLVEEDGEKIDSRPKYYSTDSEYRIQDTGIGNNKGLRELFKENTQVVQNGD
jgi:hypothetical protein